MSFIIYNILCKNFENGQHLNFIKNLKIIQLKCHNFDFFKKYFEKLDKL